MDDLKTPLTLGLHQMPGVWRYMLPDDLQYMRFPAECGSTCSACPKVVEENFHPDVRCCTYHPRVPNFLLGFALEDPETAPLVEAMIVDGLASPEGLQATALQMRTSLEHAVTPSWGGEPTIVCRFLDAKNRRCGIYKYRDSVCATFFCKHDEEDKGYEFWRKLQAVAGQCETALAQWAMDELGLATADYVKRFDAMSPELPKTLSVAASAGGANQSGWSSQALQSLWGEWLGREAAFYLACAQLVREHKDKLAELISTRVILSPRIYDQTFYEAIPPELQKVMREDGATPGEPMTVYDLWYQFSLIHRNYWLR